MQAQIDDNQLEPKPDPAIVAEQILHLVSALPELKLEQAVTSPPSRYIAQMKSGDFEMSGLRLAFAKQQDQARYDLHFYAEVGRMPFTAEAPDRRAAIIQILDGAYALPHVRFSLDKKGIIHLESHARFSHDPDDADVMMALIVLRQEATPFLQLIAENL